jgi:hypothetical protein
MQCETGNDRKKVTKEGRRQMKCLQGLKIRKHMLTGLGLVIFLTIVQIVLPVSAEESIAVYCYRDGSSIGSAVVFDVTNAANACNSLYYDCRGKCIGCFNDYDFIDYICVDRSGRTFLR